MQLGVLGVLGVSAVSGGSRALVGMGEGVGNGVKCDMAMTFNPTDSGDLRIVDPKGSLWDCSLLDGSFNYVVAATKEGPEGFLPDLWGQPYVTGLKGCSPYVKSDCSDPLWKKK